MSALKDLSQPLVGFPEEAEKEHTIFANDSDSGIRDSFDTEEHFPQGYGLLFWHLVAIASLSDKNTAVAFWCTLYLSDIFVYDMHSVMSPGALGLAAKDTSPSAGHNNLGTFNGCFVPCALNIMGIILFLRLGCTY